MKTNVLKFFVAFLVATASTQCGSGGASIHKNSIADVTGNITSESGSQGDLAGWLVVLMEKDTGITRVGVVDSLGSFTLPHTYLSRSYTVALLSPSFVFQSILSYPSVTTNKVLQYFTLNSSKLPSLIQKGLIVTFRDLTGVSFDTNRKVSASKGDGIPDGMNKLSSFGLLNALRASSAFGLVTLATNANDPDLDGNGIPNVFDPDDDANGVVNVFDQYSYGTKFGPDISTGVNNLHFSDGVEWISVRYDTIPSGTSSRAILNFATKLRSSAPTPLAVQIRGPTSLFASAKAEIINSSGKLTTATWDKTLLDDGKNGDASAKDLIFGRKVDLASGKTPSYNQVVFFQLMYGTKSNPWYLEFPFTFAPVSIGSLDVAFDTSSHKISISGTPFAKIQSKYWYWSVDFFDSSTAKTSASGLGTKIYSTSLIQGSTSTYTVPASILTSKSTYNVRATAQSPDRIPGYPALTVESSVSSVTMP